MQGVENLVFVEIPCFLFTASISAYKVLIQANLNISNELNFSGAGCSKLMTLLVNVLLKFQTLMSNMR